MAQLFTRLLGQPPQALLFDLDGTLVDSVPDIAVAVDAMLATLGFPAAGEQRVREWVGNGALKLVQRSLAFSLDSEESVVDREQLQTAHQHFLRHYQVSNGCHSRLYPGVADSLAAWAQQGMAMAIVTNKPVQFVPTLLANLSIEHYFQVCLGGECVAARKPDPTMLLQACEHLNTSVANVVMIGDSANDIEAARRAGIPVVAVDYGYNHGRPVAEENPDGIISDLRELLA